MTEALIKKLLSTFRLTCRTKTSTGSFTWSAQHSTPYRVGSKLISKRKPTFFSPWNYYPLYMYCFFVCSFSPPCRCVLAIGRLHVGKLCTAFFRTHLSRVFFVSVCVHVIECCSSVSQISYFFVANFNTLPLHYSIYQLPQYTRLWLNDSWRPNCACGAVEGPAKNVYLQMSLRQRRPLPIGIRD
jgi:hypothetical protein